MLILRYSNFETDTLEAHENQLQHGSVLWGWWKKSHESFPQDLLQRVRDLATGSGVRIGLVARADEEFAVATCTQVLFRPDGEAFASPQPEETPSYYSKKPCAAWFRFSTITRTSVDDWTAEFGPVPSGDPTLFEAKRPRPSTYPTPVIHTNAKPGQMGVLHISDLHFGEDHGHVVRPSAVNAPPSLAQRISASLTTKPACVVISGDLTTRGEHAGFLSARNFITELMTLLDIEQNAVVILPGNHDILINDPEVTRDFSNEQDFRDQLHTHYGIPTELERVHDIRDSEGRHYIIGALNSSRPRHKKTMDYGYVGIDRSAPVFETVQICAQLARSPSWSAVALHHHVLPGPHIEDPDFGRPVSMTLDAGEIVSLAQKHRADALLHGHQHIPFVGKVARLAEFTMDGATDHTPTNSVAVLGAGSAGVSRPRIPEAVGLNTFSFYTPFETGGTLVECFGYLQQRNVHRLWRVLV